LSNKPWGTAAADFIEDTATAFINKVNGVSRSGAPINNSYFSGLQLLGNVRGASRAGSQTPLKDGLRQTFRGEEGAWDSFKVGDNRYSGMAIGGAISMLGIGYRVASGGGIYRNSDGDFDIPGVPFL
jgi:hypothetical protein